MPLVGAEVHVALNYFLSFFDCLAVHCLVELPAADFNGVAVLVEFGI